MHVAYCMGKVLGGSSLRAGHSLFEFCVDSACRAFAHLCCTIAGLVACTTEVLACHPTLLFEFDYCAFAGITHAFEVHPGLKSTLGIVCA